MEKELYQKMYAIVCSAASHAVDLLSTPGGILQAKTLLEKALPGQGTVLCPAYFCARFKVIQDRGRFYVLHIFAPDLKLFMLFH